MCGIAGIYKKNGVGAAELELVKKMNQILKHRGPDDEGIFQDNNCILGHRRLSIIDLSKNGHQPFNSDCGRYKLVYNGEIYNYIELREELEKQGIVFKTKTDTEVLLKAYLAWGEKCLSKFNGMFAFVVYDNKEKTLFIARDRVGVKPLYYLQLPTKFIFASEQKALAACRDTKLTANKQTIFDFIMFSRTNLQDETFFNEIKRFPKGHDGLFDGERLTLHQWWNPLDYIERENNDTLEQITEKVEDILVSAVRLRMRSDVPVGSCLSGGLDSTILLGILLKHKMTANNYSTFTASFPNEVMDETKYIDGLQKEMDFINYRTYPNADKALKNLEDIFYYNEEPSMNPTFCAQYEVMRLAKEKGVTVLLDGQGGDESFAGYHYLHGFYQYGKLRKHQLVAFIKNFFSSMLRQQDALAFQTLAFRTLPKALQKKVLLSRPSYLNKEFTAEHLDKSIVFNAFMQVHNLNQSLALHFLYKLEHLLHFEDRNSMAFSLEARVPYLDYRLVEYLLSINEDLKIKLGETKYIQKLAVGKYTSNEILNRRDKIGFGIPYNKWMDSPQWQELTKNSFASIRKDFPGFINANSSMPKDAYERWKIIQLAKWKEVFLSQTN